MRRSFAPFGNDLQDEFDVKVICGKIVHVSKDTPVHSASTNVSSRSGRNLTSSTSRNSPNNSPKEILKLPPIQQTTGLATGRLQKNKFHSAPPKLHCPTTPLMIHLTAGATGISDQLSKFNHQLEMIQKKRPNTFEDVMQSCTRLDDLRNGTISLQELADVLYVNGISVAMETLKEFVEYNEVTVFGDSSQVLYKRFIDRVTERHTNTNSTRATCELQASKSNLPVNWTHKTENNSSGGTNGSELPSRTAMSCPEWQVAMVAKQGSCDDSSIDEEDRVGADDVLVLLSDLCDCFGGTRWGSHGDIQRFKSALAKADRRNSECLSADVVSRILHDQCVPLRGELKDKAFIQCEVAQGMIRWTTLIELIVKALSGSQATPASLSMKREITTSDLHTRTIQEGVPRTTMTDDEVRQQTQELLERVSQISRTDEPLQKLCNALYTCDPHRTGFLDISTVMRMARNYNIVYRMGLDMTGLESFVRANSSWHKTHHNKVPQTVITISIPLVVNQLLRQLGDNPNSNIT